MSPKQTTSRSVIGTMTGTSIDGIDVALVHIAGAGLSIRAELQAHAARPLGEMREPLRKLAAGIPMAAEEIARLAWEFGKLHADVIQAMLSTHDHGGPPDLIAVHGQTVFHRPPHSWQFINPAPIAERFSVPVIFDLRQADLSAGGQGAPITPIADWVMFRDRQRRRAIVNLGGFCNATILPACHDNIDDPHRTIEKIEGFDLCVCNQLLDAIAREALRVPYDDRGEIARSGAIDTDAARELMLLMQTPRDRQLSLGTGDECFAWLRTNLPRLAGRDLAATAISAIAQCIGQRLSMHGIDEVVLAGGGVRNDTLVDAITSSCRALVSCSEEHQIPAEAREAVAMAILGVLSADGVPITLPRVTGCRAPAPVAGTLVQSPYDQGEQQSIDGIASTADV